MTNIVITAIALTAIAGTSMGHDALAQDRLTIIIPRHSTFTRVQRLNRDGVDAVKSHKYDKAESYFYKAYLYDPADPFTLNNLGYISELEGQLERAQKFYKLATEQRSTATIDKSNTKNLEGRTMEFAFEDLQEVPMRVNRMNVNAMELLAERRGPEAIALLQQSLLLDPRNPFTLNNLGVSEESIGDYEAALQYYSAASDMRSTEPVVLTLDRTWAGKPVSEMAAESKRRLEERVRKTDVAEAQAVISSLHGVAAINRNDWSTAREDFLHAYSLDPASAFSLNNRGYVAEMDGDLETAQSFYDQAKRAGDANARVGLATLRSAEGMRLQTVAADSSGRVDNELAKYSKGRRGQTGPIELTPRNEVPGGASRIAPQEPLSKANSALSPSVEVPSH